MNFVGGNVLNVFVRLLNGEYVAPRAGSKNDEAHPPIHPIAMPGNLDQRHGQVYEYIGNISFVKEFFEVSAALFGVLLRRCERKRDSR